MSNHEELTNSLFRAELQHAGNAHKLETLGSIDKIAKIAIAELKQYLLDNNISNNYISSIKPFTLILDNNSEILIKKSLRVLPGRRIVFYGVINNTQQVILKLFIDSQKCSQDYKKISRNYNLLLNLGLSTPLVIYANCFVNNLSYILYEYIENGFDNYDHIKVIIEAIAVLHNNGVYQQDLHIDNFIVNNNKAYYLDLQSLKHGLGMTKTSLKLGDVTALDNFALFLAQFDINHHEQWPDFINLYFSRRNNIDNIIEVKSYILKKAQIIFKNRLDRFVFKSQRNSSYFEKIKTKAQNNKYQGVRISDYYLSQYKLDLPKGYITDLIESLQLNSSQFIKNNQVKILKNGNSAKVILIEFKGKKLILKHYIPKSFLYTIIANIKYLLIKPRALQSWLNANLLTHMGVNTARPIAMIDKMSMGMVSESFFIMEYIDDFVRLSELLEDKATGTKDYYISQAKQLLSFFNQYKIVHRDFKSVNIGFSGNKLTILDLDSMKKYKTKLFYSRVKNKDLLRLLKCLPRGC